MLRVVALLSLLASGSAFRLVPKAVDISRRSFATIPAGLVAAGAMPKVASAKITGSTPADGSYAVAVVSHGTTDYSSWRKIFQNFLDLPADQQPTVLSKSIRIIVCRTPMPDKSDGVCVLSVFPTQYAKEVYTFFDDKKNPVFVEGRKEGWLTGTLNKDVYIPQLFRGAKPGPPQPLAKGAGFVFGTHDSKISFDEWAKIFTSPEADDFHDSVGVIASVAGYAAKGASMHSKNSGPAAVHFTKDAAGAQAFAASFDNEDLVKQEVKAGVIKLPVFLTAGEVTDDIILPGHPPL